jgi:hypothetical protein
MMSRQICRKNDGQVSSNFSASHPEDSDACASDVFAVPDVGVKAQYGILTWDFSPASVKPPWTG